MSHSSASQQHHVQEKQQQLESLLSKFGTNVATGLTSDQVLVRREDDGTFNNVDPPINCPPAVCCLLPCIKSVPSMKAFRQIRPEDAEVKRNNQWIRYDATSLVSGDVIRLQEGDVVPADAVLLEVLQSDGEFFLVDHRIVTGDDKLTSANYQNNHQLRTPPSSSSLSPLVQLYWGGQVVQGSALALVTAIGPHTLIASLIRKGHFPPKQSVLQHNDDVDKANRDEETGIALLQRNSASSLS